MSLVRWWVFATMAIVAGIFGFIGFRQLPPPANGGEPSVLDSFYFVVQLYILQSGAVAPPTPPALDIARLLAPLSFGSAALSGLFAVCRDQVEGARARRRTGHLVVCGLGDDGLQVTRSALDLGLAVTVIEADPRSPLIEVAREAGAVVIVGDAREAATLLRARAHRAERIISLTANDGTNLSVRRAALEVVAHRPGHVPVDMSIRIENHELCRQLQIYELGLDTPTRIDYFSIVERTARLLVDFAGAVLRSESPHVTDGRIAPVVDLVGTGALRAEVALRVNGLWEGLRGVTPALPPLIVRTFDGAGPVGDRSDHGGEGGDEGADRRVGREPLLIICCGDDLERAVADALELAELHHARGCPILTPVGEHTGLDVLFAPPAPGVVSRPSVLTERIIALPVRSTVCEYENLRHGFVEEITVAKYQAYLARTSVPPVDSCEGGDSPVARPDDRWGAISEEERASNRAAVMDLIRGLRELGLGIALASRSAPSPAVLPLADAEVEQLAEREHTRWLHEKTAAGWRYGAVRVDTAKVSPYVRPWVELPLADRAEVYAEVREFPGLLQTGGFQLLRVNPAPIESLESSAPDEPMVAASGAR